MIVKTQEQIEAQKARSAQDRAAIRKLIIQNATVAEPSRDALVSNLVEYRSFYRGDVVEVLDGLIAEGIVKTVNGNIAIVEGVAAGQAAPLPAPPQALGPVTTPAPSTPSADKPLVKVKVLDEVALLALGAGALLPTYADQGAAGADLYAADERVEIPEHGNAVIRTGIAVELPPGYRATIHSRSGLSARFAVEKGGGLLDNSYRGEIRVILYNHGSDPFVVTRGERIAQMCVEKFEQALFVCVATLSETSRGAGGFGSTGR